MPLDGHAYLVSQGWKGKGTGLRNGAIARPVTMAQKKSLAGVGKDRDDAFPFWDHVFEAAAINIQVKIRSGSDDSSGDEASTPTVSVERTSTGIISHRRPKTGTPVVSGTVTPDPQGTGSSTPRPSVMATAKQEAARRMLYAMFFRGPVLTSDPDEESIQVESHENPADSETVEDGARKKRKRSKDEAAEATRKVSRRLRKEKAKEIESKLERKRRRQEERSAKEAEVASGDEEALGLGEKEDELIQEGIKSERRKLKEKKRARKEERRKRKERSQPCGDDR